MDNQVISTLQQLKSIFESDSTLPLASGNTPIFGEGTDNASIFVIGEAPGELENETGRLFVGRSGQLFRKTMQEADFDINKDVYITNIIKHHPPGNRDPTPIEIEAYRPYLDRQIELIKPKLIITLGRFSMNKFISGTTITKIHGKTHWITIIDKQIMLIPMFHPAYALRSPQIKNMFIEDFAKIKSALDYQAIMGDLPISKQDTTTQIPLI